MSSEKWLSIAEKKKKSSCFIFKKKKNHPFNFLMTEAALFPFKITSLASVSSLLSVSMTNVGVLLRPCPFY